MFSLSDSESILKKAMTELELHWQNTGAHWNDNARVEFEKEHIETILLAAENARRAMRNVDLVCREAVRDCR